MLENMMTDAAFDRLRDEVADLRTKLAVAERDTEMLDWLQEQTVDTVYLDDGRIVDVRGNSVRDAIRAAMEGR